MTSILTRRKLADKKNDDSANVFNNISEPKEGLYELSAQDEFAKRNGYDAEDLRAGAEYDAEQMGYELAKNGDLELGNMSEENALKYFADKLFEESQYIPGASDGSGMADEDEVNRLAKIALLAYQRK